MLATELNLLGIDVSMNLLPIGANMKSLLSIVAVSAVLISAAAPASAKGCLTGAAVGGVAGHYAGHHGLAGAAIGCAVGRHRANKKEREQQAAANNAAAPNAATDRRDKNVSNVSTKSR